MGDKKKKNKEAVNKNAHRRKGFTLIELLIYLAIFSAIAGLFVSSLLVITRVQLHENSNTSLTEQINFVTQTIQRYIRESSTAMVNTTANCTTIDDDTTTPMGNPIIGTCLRLRMRDLARDPVCIYEENSTIKITEGPTGDPNTCNTGLAKDLTNISSVQVDANGLMFTKFQNAPGHDTIQIDLTMSFQDQGNPLSTLSRTITSAVSRATAATFDSSLTPGAGSLDIGSTLSRWGQIFGDALNIQNNAAVNGDLTVGNDITITNDVAINGTLTETGNYDGGARGSKVIYAPGGILCGTGVCANHGLTCRDTFDLIDLVSEACTVSDNARLCFCD
ncbi:MAG: hypothetical protein COU08_00645 [Candidatus Harrisonbacteria bacterium CG10_big_fil_rev_8_21_14_0_10_42_17]|uniref:Uncharacterized protein n=1 Tax=Candidatus Harrisonbacteria bacterium CG10_big_fil_rev_8_21_14_0_10_42_17 TaxID=1974584 RepID=A0A2M6WJ26_9BACT|nr:MAG: hypothetical protein COU08_00645 [Candidatus Harrisonbacteria bacterium CG10_big_fil_rev_8_21_14_0_10_42_17]